MNAKTLEAVKRHGETLLALFPNAEDKNPVALCRKLRRIETSISKTVESFSSIPDFMTQDQFDHACQMALIRTTNLLGLNGPLNGPQAQIIGLFVNRDPRGYALKLDSDNERFKLWQDNRLRDKLPCLHADWGQNGIIAPDLNVEN